MQNPIPFNKSYITGKEQVYIEDVLSRKDLNGNGFYSKKCLKFFKQNYGFTGSLTNSATDALEVAALLLEIKPGDEIIMPSFTFVSTANAFILRGASIKFVDSQPNSPNIDENLIEQSITKKTKAIVVVHYGGIACDMDIIMGIAKKHNLHVIEDAAHAIDSCYNNKPLGSFGTFAAFSFHSTKNITSGEGGLLVINNKELLEPTEIALEKGTNKTSFIRGETDYYEWVNIGSSVIPSEITAAFLFAQLENLKKIQEQRIAIWNQYYEQLQDLKLFEFQLPEIPTFATNNAHLFFIICPTKETRTQLISYLNDKGIKAVFHYQALHNSYYFKNQNTIPLNYKLPNAEKYSSRLLRLPLYPDLTVEQIKYISNSIKEFVSNKK